MLVPGNDSNNISKLKVIDHSIPQKPVNISKKVMKQRIQPIPGYADYTEAQNQLFSDWKKKLGEVYARHGFTAFNSRPVEKWENLRKDGTDQQVFRIARDNGKLTDIALPFDRTVSLALYVAKYVNKICFPFKRHDINYSHRGEQPQPGRFRGFYQCDVDIINRKLSVEDDIECLVTLLRGLDTLEVKGYVMYLNQIELPKSMIRSLGVPEEKQGAVLRLIDKLDKKSPEEIADSILEIAPNISEEKLSEMVKIFTYRGPLSGFQVQEEWGEGAQKAVRELKQVYNLLPAYGIELDTVQFCPGMVRGLAYYTGLVFETFFIDHPELGSIASGGRYVNLVGDFNPACKAIGGVGGAIGLTRLFDIMLRKKMVNPNKRTVAMACVGYDKGTQKEAIQFATELRNQGVAVDLFTTADSKKFFAYTDKKGIPYAILVKKEGIAVKDMLAGRNAADKQRDFINKEEAVQHVYELTNQS